MHPPVWLILPAFNEERVIESVLAEIIASGYTNIIVVDDGSSDQTAKRAGNVPGVTVLRHPLNRGKGAATKTGIEAAKLLGAEIMVTMDSDGQHAPEDIARVIEPLLWKKCDVVLGTRSLGRGTSMPIHKRVANIIGNFLTWYLYGLWVHDSQSGFRAYSKSSLERIHTKTDRYEYESEVIKEIARHKLRFREVPISVRYTEYSTSKTEKQSFSNGLKTAYKLLLNIFS